MQLLMVIQASGTLKVGASKILHGFWLLLLLAVILVHVTRLIRSVVIIGSSRAMSSAKAKRKLFVRTQIAENVWLEDFHGYFAGETNPQRRNVPPSRVGLVNSALQ
jgi:hypothetical protein